MSSHATSLPAGPHATAESALARWFVRFLDRSDVEKALLIAAVSLAARVVNALAIHLALARRSFQVVVQPEVAAVLERSLWMMAGFWAAMVAWGLLVRNRAPRAFPYVTLVVQGVVVSGVWVAYLGGHYTSQAAMILVGFLVLCYLAFPRRQYQPASAVAGGLFLGVSIAERMEWIPYGPLFPAAPGGVAAHPDPTLAFLDLGVIAVALFLIGGAVIFNVRRLRASEALLREESRTDPLTGLPNRRSLLESARHQLAHAARHRLPVSVLVIDVDHFKDVNDRSGHDAGDRVLAILARVLRDTIREEDTIARFGGDEFVAILPGADCWDAEPVAERCRRAVEAAALSLEGGSGPITVSVGVAQHVGSLSPAPEEIIARADRALYWAKAAGRNTVRIGRITSAAEERFDRPGDALGTGGARAEI